MRLLYPPAPESRNLARYRAALRGIFYEDFFSMKNFTALKCADFLHVNFLRAFLFAYCDATGTPQGALKDFACGLSPSVFTAKICRLCGVQF